MANLNFIVTNMKCDSYHAVSASESHSFYLFSSILTLFMDIFNTSKLRAEEIIFWPLGFGPGSVGICVMSISLEDHFAQMNLRGGRVRSGLWRFNTKSWEL